MADYTSSMLLGATIIYKLNMAWRVLAAGISYTVFGLCTLLFSLILLVILPLPIPKAKKQNGVRLCIRVGCKAFVDLMQALGLMTYSQDVHIVNESDTGCVVIANHPSLIDAIFILGVCRDMCCIAKNGLNHNPFTGVIIRSAAYVTNSNSDFLDAAVAKIKSGQKVLIFPEGTRNQYDDQVDFKRGAANIAIKAQCPILPIRISCSPRALQKGQKWYDMPEVPSHFQLEAAEMLRIEDCIDTTQPRTLQYRNLTEFLKRYYKRWINSSVEVSEQQKLVVGHELGQR